MAMATSFSSALQASLNLGSMIEEYDNNSEVFRQRFRQFQYKEAAGPREVFTKLRELCHEWLKPKTRSKEQMVELLVLEQFLIILPRELETWLTEQCPETTESVVSLLEGLETKLEIPEPQIDRQEMLLEDPAAVGMADVPPDISLETLPPQAMGPVSEAPVAEAPVAEAQIPQAGLQELSDGATGEDQAFLDPAYQPPKPDPIEPWMKELQDCMEVEQLQLLDINIGGNALLGPSLPEDSEHPRNQLENPTEHVPREYTLLVCDQNSFPEERAEISNQEEPLSPRAHEQNHDQKSPHQCTHCGKEFVSSKVLSGHLKIHVGDLPHECLECGKRFLRKSNLERHLQVHRREAPYKCNGCEKHFSQLSHLTEHQKASSGQEVYVCPECRERFCNRKGFANHLKIHTNGKPFKCHSCGKTFHRQRDLSVHYMTHTEERPFMCDHCGKSYRHKSSLRFHLRKHSGESRRSAPIVSQAS
ncbi:zinc finger protein 449-like [Sturnira hondurensis]|uniref:zinc finger protein 449-like n=1 Tax=Sturnira hondurensis TaxID=192404 RepID=UPI00187A3C54|nr:zinc finger protein 449-like [Sturnira hondurensis]